MPKEHLRYVKNIRKEAYGKGYRDEQNGRPSQSPYLRQQTIIVTNDSLNAEIKRLQQELATRANGNIFAHNVPYRDSATEATTYGKNCVVEG